MILAYSLKTLTNLLMIWMKLLTWSQLLIINMGLSIEKKNNKNLHSLVIDVVEDLFLTKTAIRIVAITMARSKAASVVKIAHKGVHK